ncbi:gamma-secretase-activating protein-like [Clytia hemisphaerica]|uniref:Gamma-secretase-activating protein C-terminal domain-containing protein n=1 Tax=Clytia hemisphaerica TaxID=252671 RepID=A0A7M5TVY0_9CNID
MIDFNQLEDFCPILKEQAQLLIQDFITEQGLNEQLCQAMLTEFSEWNYDTKLIGKEPNNILLFSWQCLECPISKTFIACYQTTSKLSKLLFHQEKALEVVNASLNDNETLLAFTTVESASKLDRDSTGQFDHTFSSYIAEIAPQNRVFSLNIEWNTYQKVQFLSHTLKSKDNVYHMIFCNHKNSIQLYELHLKRAGDGNIIMTQQPSTKQIAGQFLWSMFDSNNQRLYYLQLLPKDEEELEAAAVVTAIDFKLDGIYEYVMNFILPIKLRMELLRNRSYYNVDHFSNIISCQTFKMNILTEERGSFYVCFQHQVTSTKYTEEESSEDDQSVISESSTSHDSILQSSGTTDSCFVNYTVICVHGAYSAHCSSVLPYDDDCNEPQIHFMLFSDYLLAFIPGSFLHFLDMSCEHEPVHNLLIRRKSCLPKMPIRNKTDYKFVPFMSESDSGDSKTEHLKLLEITTLCVYNLTLNAASMYKFFLSSKPQIRLSILHGCLNHFNHSKLTKKVLARICQDPANSDSLLMLKEYLVLAPYVELRKSVSLLDMKVFPFTTQSCYRGQVERNSSGRRDVYLSYKTFKEDLVIQIQKVFRCCLTGFWRTLLKIMTHESQYRNKRVSLSIFYMAGIDVEESAITFKAARGGRRNTSFVVIPRPSVGTLDDSTLHGVDKLSIDDSAIDEDRKFNENLNAIATQLIANYVSRHFGQDMKPRIDDLCLNYMEHRCESIEQLWKVVLKSLDLSDEGVRFCTLDTPSDELELAAFQLVERVKVICDQLCYPQLNRMNDLLCSLSFRSLRRFQFVRYVDACVFKVNINFVRRVIKEVPENNEKSQLIEILLGKLSKTEVQKILLEWNNPIGRKYLSEYVSWKMPFNEIHTPNNTNFEQVFPNGDEFMPLKTLLHAFKVHGKTSAMFGGSRRDKKQNDMLAETALYETNMLLKPSDE